MGLANDGVHNAVIESVSLSFEDRGILDAWLLLTYGGSSQGFGGYALYLPKSYKHHKINSPAGHHLFRCMEIAGVTDWSKMKGRAIRVQIEKGLIVAIGHIINDDWYSPRDDFAKEAA